jgi:hypothetical protein
MGYWREKPLNQRLKDTYDFIRKQMAGVEGVDAGITSMDLRTRALDAAGNLARLLEVMSLGFRWELIKSADETRRRHYIRSVLFGLGRSRQCGQAPDGRPGSVKEGRGHGSRRN